MDADLEKQVLSAHAAIAALEDDLPFAPSAKPTQDRTYTPAATHQDDECEAGAPGLIRDGEQVVRFIQAGKATLTVKSNKTGERFTFKFSRPKEDDSGRQRPIWVSLLSGADNTGDYAFIGTVWVGSPAWTLRQSAKSRVALSAPSAKALLWVLKHINMGSMDQAVRQAEFWHEGRCGRCGRKLTVPESISSGFGPECINYV